MAALPLPPKQTATRELLLLARKIERYGAQRRKLLTKVAELEANIRQAKSLLRQLAESMASPVSDDGAVLAVDPSRIPL